MEALALLIIFFTDYEQVEHKFYNSQKTVVQERILQREDTSPSKAVEIKEFFESYNSPLADFSQDFFKASRDEDLDYRLLPSIAMVESTGGKFTPSCAEYNPFGWSEPTSPCFYRQFESFDEAIHTVAKGISRNSPYAEFRASGKISDLAKKYNPGGSEKWTRDVKYFMEKF